MMATTGRWRWLVSFVFFVTLLLLGIALHRDYGVSWDEPNNHLNGLVTLKYLANLLPADNTLRHHPTFLTTPNLREFPDSHHGPVFEVAAIAISYLITDHDSRSYFFVRHFMVFSVSMLGIWALYRLGTYWLRDWRWGLLGASILVASPRFFAESFYNGKDIVYMGFFTLSMFTLTRLLRRLSLGRAIVHGFATALTIDVRVHGSQLLLFTALALLLERRYTTSASSSTASLGRLFSVYVATTLIVATAGWPYLWAHSLPELLAVSKHAVRYPWGFTNFYLGQHLLVEQLPWHYIPVWILITTPIPYIVAALAGLLLAARRVTQQRATVLRTANGRLAALLALWLLAPLALVMSTHVVVYEGWRHLYYIYPSLVLWAVWGIRELVDWGRAVGLRRRLAHLLLTLGALETAHTIVRIVQMHPHQNVYFSFLPGDVVDKNFERDYWCLAYRQGLEWILAHDASPSLKVNVFWHYPLRNNSLILPPHDRARLSYTPDSTARYYLAGYRWHPQSYLDSLGTEVYSIREGGVKVLSVFQRY
ncbi:hypothetical protein [Hymenobacter sp. APR13]|uniref:hypothetical protein n=1 Tax=Hymenobacter sp. APR13 TaxID=1356852 RepID=UPI0012E00788|nr:hypothetical protein [Hymenobacter sp. APR13]